MSEYDLLSGINLLDEALCEAGIADTPDGHSPK